MNSRPRTGAAAVGLGLGLSLLACLGCGNDSAIQVHHDANGNEQINVDNKKIKDNLRQAGQELKDGAHQLAGSVRQEAHDANQNYGTAARETVDDTALTAKVKARLIADSDVDGVRVHVSSRDGQVTLTGEVASDANRRAAEDVAHRTDGVKGVDNQIKVVPAKS